MRFTVTIAGLAMIGFGIYATPNHGLQAAVAIVLGILVFASPPGRRDGS